MSPVYAVVFVLFVVFVIICVECVLRKKISYIVKNINEDESSIEFKVRETVLKNPESEVIILCTSKNPDTITVLDKLQEDFPQLHILK